MKANLIANFDKQLVFILFALSNFFFFLLNQKVVLLISKNKIMNYLYNLPIFIYNLTSFSFLI